MSEEADTWKINDTVDYICSRKYTIVTAQFPDDLLSIAPDIISRIQHACSTKNHQIQIYILADTTYNSLSVDEVAAAHINAQCVIHYGRASLTKLSRLPAFYVFPTQYLDIKATADALLFNKSGVLSLQSNRSENDDSKSKKTCVVFLDQCYIDVALALRQELESLVETHKKQQKTSNDEHVINNDDIEFIFAEIATRYADPSETTPRFQQEEESDTCHACDVRRNKINEEKTQSNILAGYSWPLMEQTSKNRDGDSVKQENNNNTKQSRHLPTFIWIGSLDVPALDQLQLTYNTAQWIVYDPIHAEIHHGISTELSKMLRRRYYLVEKARNSNVVGILVGTLGVAGYADAIQKLRKLAHDAGKKTYTLLMGKPSPAKLANFPEIEIFVLVADPQGQILDSKEYLAPIITPHEAMLAFTSDTSEWNAESYRLDFDGLFQISDTILEKDHSIKKCSENGEKEMNETADLLALQAQNALIVSAAPQGRSDLIEIKSAAEYYVHRREWKGVETPLVGYEVKDVVDAVDGSSGRAAGYTHEKKT